MKISEDVCRVLSGLQFESRNVRILEQLDRKLYLETDKVLQALGGKWNKKAKAHVFPTEAEVLVDQAIVAQEVTTAADLGFFPTPSPLARQLVELAGVSAGESVLEPSAGEGALVEVIVARAPLAVIAIERDEARRAKLVEQRRSVHDWACVSVCNHDDFLDYGVQGMFDRVVMNPPFRKVGKGDHLDHVVHAFNCLKFGGTLVSVLPAGISFRQDKRHVSFRVWVEKLGSIDPLPDDAFKSSGTGVRTVVIKLMKSRIYG